MCGFCSFRRDSDRADLIPSTIANVKWPQIVIKFYEERVTWTQNNEHEENGESWGSYLSCFYLAPCCLERLSIKDYGLYNLRLDLRDLKTFYEAWGLFTLTFSALLLFVFWYFLTTRGQRLVPLTKPNNCYASQDNA